MRAVFTVFFEGPFWVGVLESEEGSGLAAARHVFGAEPTNAELLDFMLHRFHLMPRCRLPSAVGPARVGEAAPQGAKRALRLARKEARRPASTRAQAALAAGLEARKAEGRTLARERREAEADKRFLLKSEKRREKRRGH
jgi:hypothetical protein